jgi:phospholipase/carboxylesterase
MSPTLLTGRERAPKSGNVKHLVIFLHGFGSNGDDLIGLANMMDLPDTQYISPNAPFRCDMAPGGYQWFSLDNRAPAQMLAGIQTAAPTLNHFIDHSIARFGVTAAQTALVGFSQGSMMSFYTAPRRPQPLAGVVAISGALYGEETLAAAPARPPFCIIHGQLDDVVPFGAMALAKTALTTHGFNVETHAQPGLGHGIDEAGLEATEAFLKRVFGI